MSVPEAKKSVPDRKKPVPAPQKSVPVAKVRPGWKKARRRSKDVRPGPSVAVERVEVADDHAMVGIYGALNSRREWLEVFVGPNLVDPDEWKIIH